MTSTNEAARAAHPALSFRDILESLAQGRDLTSDEAGLALEKIVDGKVQEVEAAALLMGLRVKGETPEEIAGMVETMRSRAVPVDSSYREQCVDVVGTGGDNLGTFNISTTTAFVLAGAGVKVAKHGNRAASSQCGSADLLEALGVRIDLGPQQIAACIEEAGIGFMMASLHHPAAGRVAGVRRALAVRTVFNFLGPLTNPAGARRLLLGVGAAEYLEVLAQALAHLGCRRALVVRGCDGMDELSVTGPSEVIEVNGGEVREAYVLEPESYGIPLHDPAVLTGGSPRENADITRRILNGWKGGPRDAVLLNAAAAMCVAGRAGSIADGLGVARESIDSGRSTAALESLIATSNKLAAGMEEL